VKLTPTMKAEAEAEAKRLGLASIAEYVRELHTRSKEDHG
jgi:hypothetical protein